MNQAHEGGDGAASTASPTNRRRRGTATSPRPLSSSPWHDGVKFQGPDAVTRPWSARHGAGLPVCVSRVVKNAADCPIPATACSRLAGQVSRGRPRRCRAISVVCSWKAKTVRAINHGAVVHIASRSADARPFAQGLAGRRRLFGPGTGSVDQYQFGSRASGNAACVVDSRARGSSPARFDRAAAVRVDHQEHAGALDDHSGSSPAPRRCARPLHAPRQLRRFGGHGHG